MTVLDKYSNEFKIYIKLRKLKSFKVELITRSENLHHLNFKIIILVILGLFFVAEGSNDNTGSNEMSSSFKIYIRKLIIVFILGLLFFSQDTEVSSP
jgi:hypothetical protein